MKKSKFLKRVGVIALSAVMTTGVALAAAACGGGGGGGGCGGIATNAEGYRAGTSKRGTDPNKLTVYIFCNDADTATNRQICNDWMKKYNSKHGTNYTVDFSSKSNKTQYFEDLSDYWSTNSMYDVIYIAPRYVRTYAETGSVLNLSDYLDKVAADPALEGEAVKEANTLAFGNIWKNALSYYSYQKGKMSGDDAYKLGQPVSFDAENYGFYTDSGHEKVGLYGLPKDYSSFATGYNRLFFSDEMKAAVTTTFANATRSVKGGSNETSGSVAAEHTYNAQTGNLSFGGKSVVQYAVDVNNYTNPYTNETVSGKKAGDPAPIINVGIPTRYYPFNFFRFNNYSEALAGGDPMALMVDAYTNGEGYVVTIPGFPNDSVRIPAGVAVDENAPYDETMGHITYTYAEYSALIWAMTYYLNTFDGQPFPGGKADGYGGTSISGNAMVVFGGEQYEGIAGAAGSVLYLLPWLYGNDADLIDSTSRYCSSLKDGKPVDPKVAIEVAKDWRNYVGNDTEKATKMNLDGTSREVDIQYGYDSQNFIETYGAFLALASDWNANNGGDTDSASSNNGWAYFRGGRALFYGAGSWDAATRNDSEPTVLEFGQMPTPVSEKYALYSKIKGANYTMEEYSNGATAKGSGNDAAKDNVQRANLSDGCKVYNAEEIAMNQVLRQDKWGARMDSVGYAVNGQVTNYTGEHAWKEEAAVSLVMALTIERSAQVTLTIGGAQFPNFKDQMEQFVNYQDPANADGAFKDMLTPEGFSDMRYYKADGTPDETVAAEAKKIWDRYYEIALAMQDLARTNSTQTVGDFLKTQNVYGEAVKYNKDFENTTFNTFVGSTEKARLANAMKVLNMVALWRSDREINLRMQYGLNAVRDSTMYTYTDAWIGGVDARDSLQTMLAYRSQQLFLGSDKQGMKPADFVARIKQNPADERSMFETPLLYALRKTATATSLLNQAISAERGALQKIGGTNSDGSK